MTVKREQKAVVRGGRSAKAPPSDATGPVDQAEPKAVSQPQPQEQASPGFGGDVIDAPTSASGTKLQIATPSAQSLALGGDIAIPLTSRAVFWQPRHAANSRSLPHVPFLFWLMETVRPTRVVHLGLEDPSAFLALCQAADKLGLEAVCMAVDLTAEASAMTPAQADQHATLYGDFSFVVAEDLVPAARHVRGGEIDLLVIDTPLDDGQVRELQAHWMPLLSEKGVLVVHDPDTNLAGLEARQYIDGLLNSWPKITFPQSRPGLETVLLGGRQPERLLRMAELELGMPGYLAAWQVFARLGQGLESDRLSRSRLAGLDKANTHLKDLETENTRLTGELDQERQLKQSALDSEADQLALLAGLQAQIFDLQTEMEAAERNPGKSGKVETLQAALEAAAEKNRSHSRRIESLSAEKATLATQLGEAREALERLEVAFKEQAEKRKAQAQKVERLAAEKSVLEAALAEGLDKAGAAEQVESLVRDLAAARIAHQKDIETLRAKLEDEVQRHETVRARTETLDKTNAELQERMRQMQDKRLAAWEVHEALKLAHAALLVRMEAEADTKPA